MEGISSYSITRVLLPEFLPPEIVVNIVLVVDMQDKRASPVPLLGFQGF